MQWLISLKRRCSEHQTISLCLVLFVALTVRVLLIFPGLNDMPQRFSRPDSPGYVQPALALVADGGFYSAPGTLIKNSARPPLFSLFLSAFFYCFDENYFLPILALCLIGALICIPVYLSAKLFGGGNIGLLAAAFFALNLTAIANSPMLLSDVLFAFFTAWQLYFFSLGYWRKQLYWWYVGIMLAGISVLIRPIGLLWYLPAVFLILIFPNISLKRKIATVLIILALFWSIVFPWMWRNQLNGAGFCVDTNTGAMYHQNGGMLLAKLNGTSYEAEKQQILKTQEIEFVDTVKYPDEKSRVDYRIAKLKELIMQHPVTYFRLHLNPQIMLPDLPTFCEILGFTKSDRGTLDIMHRYGVIAAIKHYFNGVLWLPLLLLPALALVGICYLGCLFQLGLWIYQKNIFFIFFFLAFVEYYLFLPGPITVPRYQMPALPFIAVIGAMGCVQLVVFLKKLYRHGDGKN